MKRYFFFVLSLLHSNTLTPTISKKSYRKILAASKNEIARIFRMTDFGSYLRDTGPDPRIALLELLRGTGENESQQDRSRRIFTTELKGCFLRLQSQCIPIMRPRTETVSESAVDFFTGLHRSLRTLEPPQQWAIISTLTLIAEGDQLTQKTRDFFERMRDNAQFNTLSLDQHDQLRILLNACNFARLTRPRPKSVHTPSQPATLARRGRPRGKTVI